MRARRIGRTLGIGARVMARIAMGRSVEQQRARRGLAQQSLATNRQLATGRAVAHGAASPAVSRNPSEARVAAQSMAPTRQTVRRGVGGILRPIRRAGGILWLEVAGVFFLLPVVAFAPALWREAAAYRHTGDHKTLWLTAGVMTVFLYLGVSSFWRAHRRAIEN